MIKLIIPGKPMGKQRPRLGKGFTYTPKETVNYETLLKQLYITEKLPRIKGPIEIKIEAYYQIPKSASKNSKILMENGRIRPTVKPDLDNIVKIICDGLNGVAYDDDKQIVKVTCEKFYANEPSVTVYINEM